VLVLTQNTSLPGDRRVWSEIRSLRAAGYDVSAICPRQAGPADAPFELREGVHIHRYRQPYWAGRLRGYLLEYGVSFWHTHRLARRLAAEGRFDFVQARNPPDFLLLAVLFLKRRGARFFFDHHDLAPELYLARFEGRRSPLYWIARVLERLSFAAADFVLATNESVKRVAVERGGKRPEEVFVVRSGPDIEAFAPVDPDPSLKRGRAHLIAYEGEMNPQDGIDHALYALADLGRRRDDWHAVFAGDGDALRGLRGLTEELGLTDRVEFTGWLSDLDLRRLLCSSDVCLVPDPKNPLSDASTLMKIAEYMAMGRAIVSYDLTESRVTAGEAALYARPNDPADLARAVNQLLDDPELRAELGALGRRRVEESLSWQHSERVLLAAYRAAAG
jgi:glycosyltransferase involved in cell wall biosynthesis